MYQLSQLFDSPLRDGTFLWTQFAGTAQENSICFASSERYFKLACGNDAISAIVTTPQLARNAVTSKGLVVVDEPEEVFYRLHNDLIAEHCMRVPIEPGLHPTARIHPTAYVDKYTQVGANVEVAPGAVVMSGSVLKENVVVGPNAVIGGDGHFFKRFGTTLLNIRHAGGVWLEAGVHVLAGAVVSRSLHPDFTRIGANSVVSVKCHVGHGCIIGERTILAGSSQISGYSKIGSDAWIGPGAVVGNLLQIGDRARIEVGSVVVQNVSEGSRVSGNFAISHSANMIDFARSRRGGRRG